MAKKPYRSKKGKIQIEDHHALAIGQRQFAILFYLHSMALVKEMFGASDEQAEAFAQRLRANIAEEAQKKV